MKLKKNSKFIVAADGAAASGKTTGSRIISRKYGLKFLSSGLLYRYAGQQLLKYKPKNEIKFLKLKFKNKAKNAMNLEAGPPLPGGRPLTGRPLQARGLASFS